MTSIARLLLATCAAACASTTLAQHTIDFSVDATVGDGRLTTTVTWATNPPAPGSAPCTASGHPEWTGPRAASGSQTITLTQSATLNLSCTWPGDSIATLSWRNPTQNEDGSPYTDQRAIVIRYRLNGDPRGAEGASRSVLLGPPPAGVVAVELEPTRTMHTITGLSGVGTYSFVAYACNQRDVCSQPSNVAVKTFTGMVDVTESIGITVNPRPGAITELAVE